jgi:ubiquinone/menaquinone biosynthesis C-methylase UbiE
MGTDGRSAAVFHSGDGRALELGAGNGAAAAEMARGDGWHCGIACVDASTTALRSFPKRLVADSRIIRLAGDARRLPFRGGSFDFVNARHVLTHTIGRDDEAILREAVRVLVSGGMLSAEVFSVRDAREEKGSNFGAGAKLREGGLVWRFYDERGLERILRKAGFAKVEIFEVRRDVSYRGAALTRESLAAMAEKPTG